MNIEERLALVKNLEREIKSQLDKAKNSDARLVRTILAVDLLQDTLCGEPTKHRSDAQVLNLEAKVEEYLQAMWSYHHFSASNIYDFIECHLDYIRYVICDMQKYIEREGQREQIE